MLTYVTTQSVSDHDSNDRTTPLKVLLVSDWIENLARVKSLLRLSHHKITYAQTAEELNYACQDSYDFVVIDVGPEHIVYALRELRASECLQNTPVFVRVERFTQAFEMTSVFAKTRALKELEAEALTREFAMTSVFTKYRAMPGLDIELAKMVSARVWENDVPSVRQVRALPGGNSML